MIPPTPFLRYLGAMSGFYPNPLRFQLPCRPGFGIALYLLPSSLVCWVFPISLPRIPPPLSFMRRWSLVNPFGFSLLYPSPPKLAVLGCVLRFGEVSSGGSLFNFVSVPSLPLPQDPSHSPIKCIFDPRHLVVRTWFKGLSIKVRWLPNV